MKRTRIKVNHTLKLTDSFYKTFGTSGRMFS
nr:MAG TPA: RIB43A [Caudoviricetes sp.]